MNYGEALAYWYLRLNGFFLVQDYVIHWDKSDPVKKLRTAQAARVKQLESDEKLSKPAIRDRIGIDWEPGASADCDLLAIRLPYVSEAISGTPLGYDMERLESVFSLCKYRMNFHTLGLIVEVKAGDAKSVDENVTFTLRGLRTLLGRTGLVRQANLEDCSQELYAKACIKRDRAIIGKLVFSRDKASDARWANIELKDAEDFILQRMKGHSSTKQADRLFFFDPLMQYIAWKHGIKQDIPENEVTAEEAKET